MGLGKRRYSLPLPLLWVEQPAGAPSQEEMDLMHDGMSWFKARPNC